MLSFRIRADHQIKNISLIVSRDNNNKTIHCTCRSCSANFEEKKQRKNDKKKDNNEKVKKNFGQETNLKGSKLLRETMFSRSRASETSCCTIYTLNRPVFFPWYSMIVITMELKKQHPIVEPFRNRERIFPLLLSRPCIHIYNYFSSLDTMLYRNLKS